jgi:uncharacterized protein
MRLFVASILLLCGTTALAGTPLPDGPHIVVTGEGKLSAKPDAARVRFDFQQRATQPLPAKQAVDAAVNKLLAGLGSYGVEEKDVSASSLSASEDVNYTDQGQRTSNGFVAERDVTVVLKSIDRLNDFLDNGLASGAHEIGEVTFESTQADALRDEARRKAVDDATKKAADMAAAFGAGLGSVYSIGSVNSRYEGLYGGATTLDRIQVTGSRATRGRYIQPTVEYTETVNAVFELKR